MDEKPSGAQKPHPSTSTQFLKVPTRHDFDLLSTASSVLELSSIGEECNEPESTQNVWKQFKFLWRQGITKYIFLISHRIHQFQQ